MGGLKSYRCLGETRNGRQCAQRCVSLVGDDFSFCADHENQRGIRLSDFRAQGLTSYTWRRLGLNEIDSGIGKELQRGRDLRVLADDDENIHTIEIQRPLIQAISALRLWADSNNLKPEQDLGKTVHDFLLKQKQDQDKDTNTKVIEKPKKELTETIVNEFWRGSMKTVSSLKQQTTNISSGKEYLPSKIEKDCIDHLNRVYSIDDKESVLGITFPVLSSWVWNRVLMTKDGLRREELVKRFVEEMAESKGLCLQGNLTRLMNVFSGMDAEVSLQEVDFFDTGPISNSYMQQQTAAAVTRFTKKLISYDELIAIVRVLMKRASASKEVLEDWLKAIEDLVTGENLK